MIQKAKLIYNFLYFKSIIFFLSFFVLKVNAETKIIAQNGDTLFKLSKQYGVSLKELMHKNNFNDANRIVEGEVIFIPIKENHNELLFYNVIQGDTLYKIAREYNLNVKDIISINNLDNSSFLKPNQIILLPKGAIYKKIDNQKYLKFANKKVFYHQTSKPEKIKDIANIHKVSSTKIITLNNLNNITTIDPNTKLKIRENEKFNWIRYGSLKINWAEWSYIDGNYVTKVKNKKNKPFYLAISCEKRTLNNTLNNSYWTGWYFPTSDFEFKLINDFCDQDLKV